MILVLALLLIPPRSSSLDTVASAPAAGAPSGGATAAPTRAVAPTPFAPIQLSGTGSDDVQFSIPDGSSGLATILNSGTGPFVVWTVAADGAQNQQLVNVVGPFAGTLLFDESEHSTAFSVESDGNWSIEVKPISSARTWDRSERLVGDGPDVILVLPPASAETNTTVRVDGEGDFVVSAYASSGESQLLNEAAPFVGPLVLPAGTSLLEVDASDAWSIAPG